jgi:hypothetical protein
MNSYNVKPAKTRVKDVANILYSGSYEITRDEDKIRIWVSIQKVAKQTIALCGSDKGGVILITLDDLINEFANSMTANEITDWLLAILHAGIESGELENDIYESMVSTVNHAQHHFHTIALENSINTIIENLDKVSESDREQFDKLREALNQKLVSSDA